VVSVYRGEILFLLITVVVPLSLLINLFRKKSFKYHLVCIFSVVYFAGLISVTLFPVITDSRAIDRQSGFHATVNFIPFKSILGSLDHPYSKIGFMNIVGNLLLLLPLGLLTGILMKRSRNMFRVIAIGLGIAVLIELTQYILTENYVIRRRVVDVDDVILNSVGFWLGYGLYKLLSNILRRGRIRILNN